VFFTDWLALRQTVGLDVFLLVAQLQADIPGLQAEPHQKRELVIEPTERSRRTLTPTRGPKRRLTDTKLRPDQLMYGVIPND
jgi:hypothetical protein